MRGRLPKYRVRLNSKQLRRLKAVVRRRSPQHWLVQRAQIVLLSHRGLRIAQICSALTVDKQVVRRWLKRFLSVGFDGLKDLKRSGRRPVILPSVWQKVATLVVQTSRAVRRPVGAMVRSRALPVSARPLWLASEPLVLEQVSAIHGPAAAPRPILAQSRGS